MSASDPAGCLLTSDSANRTGCSDTSESPAGQRLNDMSSTTTLPRELIGNPDEDAEPEADAQTLHVAVHGAVTCNRQTAVLAHPLVWMAAGLLVFTAAILFPPDLYARLFAETSAMYLDPLSSIYTLSCVGLILAGLWCGLGGSFSTIPPRTLVGTDLDQLPVTGHGLLVLLTLGNITSSLLFVRFGGLRVLLEAIQGTEKLDRKSVV